MVKYNKNETLFPGDTEDDVEVKAYETHLQVKPFVVKICSAMIYVLVNEHA